MTGCAGPHEPSGQRGRRARALRVARRGLACGAALLAAGCGAGGDAAREAEASGQPPLTTPELAELLAEGDPFARVARLAEQLGARGAGAAGPARAALEGPLDGGDGALPPIGVAEAALLLRAWALAEPERAARWALVRSPLEMRAAAVASAVEIWATRDPEAALWAVGAAQKLPVGSEEAERALVRGWYGSGRPGLVDYIRDLGMSIEQQRAVATLLRERIRREGPDAVVRWAASLPDEPRTFKLATFRNVGTELARVDLDAALAWCEAHCEGSFGSNLRKRIAVFWVGRDAPAALDWLARAPAGRERDFAVRVAFDRWLRDDRGPAATWIDARGPEALPRWLRPAAVVYAKARAESDPPAALRWAALVLDARERELTLARIARSWYAEDPRAAEAWLEGSPLPEPLREQVRSTAPAAPTS